MRALLPTALRKQLGLESARRRPRLTDDRTPAPVHEAGHVLARFSVPGEPVPKGRPRLVRAGHVITPPRTVEAEQRIQQYLFVAYPGLRPYSGRVAVKIRFYVCSEVHTDLDNLLKLVLDACCNGGIVTNDWLIDDFDIKRRWVQREPRTEITISVLGDVRDAPYAS